MSETLAFPRWVHCADGASRIAPNRAQYDAFMSIEGPKATDPEAEPPTIEKVLAAGYSQEYAESVVAEYARATAAGEKPDYSRMSIVSSAPPPADPPLAVVPEPEPILDAPVADSKKAKTKKADPKPVEDPAGIFAKE